MSGYETFLLFLGPALALLSGLALYRIGETPEDRARLVAALRGFLHR